MRAALPAGGACLCPVSGAADAVDLGAREAGRLVGCADVFVRRLEGDRDISRLAALAVDEPLESDLGQCRAPCEPGLDERGHHHAPLMEPLNRELKTDRIHVELIGERIQVDGVVRELAQVPEDRLGQFIFVELTPPAGRREGRRNLGRRRDRGIRSADLRRTSTARDTR
jgi:hypothetical protein